MDDYPNRCVGRDGGVTNNVFTPWTYNDWPTVYNYLEAAYGNNIDTTVIANWPVITDIAGAGAFPADKITFVGHSASDPTGSRRRTRLAS